MRLAARALIAVALVLVAMPAVGPEPASAGAPLAPLSAKATRPIATEVFGYLPTWEVRATTEADLRYDLLTTIAFFEIPVRRDGSLDRSSPGYRTYTGDRAAAITRRAHAAGVRAVVTFTSFGAQRNAAFLGSAAARDRFVREALALMQARGADGVSLDVESIRTNDVAAYGTLVHALASSTHRNDRAAQVSVATQASALGARMAATAVASGADRVFVMTYAMRTALADTAGSVDPLDRPGSTYSIRAALDLYAARGVAPARTLLGLPLFGMVWPTAGDTMHAARRGPGRAIFASTLASVVPREARMDRDPVEGTARWTWYDKTAKTWRQAYVDDPTATTTKARFALDRGMAGIGLWALGYDRGQGAYWDALGTALRRDVAPPVVTSLAIRFDRVHQRWRVTFAAADVGSGIASYRAVYLVGSGHWRPLAAGPAASVTLRLPATARIRVAVQAVDRAGNGSAWRYTYARH